MRGDYHVHTHYLGCANSTMTLEAIAREAERLGIDEIAITDHLNSLDVLEKHASIKSDIGALDGRARFYFGVELNFLSRRGGFAYDESVRDRMGFQFAIGGIHSTYLDSYDLVRLIDVQHEHHLLTCTNPLVDVLVHPWWFSRNEFDRNGFPWFDDMSVVPDDLTRELGRAASGTGTAIEINACAIFANPGYPYRFKAQYVDYLRVLADEGARFALCTDAHDIAHLSALSLAEAAFRELSLPAERLWRPGVAPL